MATWKSENSMLTQKGVEILNKIKAGVGKITVSRVVIGSERIAESKLFTATQVSGSSKALTISEVKIIESGSEISVHITNTDFTESFNVNQIGVYVTHPDYSGEQLYHISQCEADDYDTIPAIGDTPVTFGYSLFLEHGNSSSIDITVDPQGMVTNQRFNVFKGSIKPDHLVCVDSEGNLQDVGKSVSELSNQNLLTNPYFPNPVNRRNGYIVPPNTPYYSDSKLTSLVANTTSYVQVSKVTNTYGTFVIDSTVYYVPWSSAVKGYTGLGVTVDRWRVTSGPNVYALLSSKGVRFGNTGSESGTIRQYTTLTPSQAIGYKFTLSVLTADGRFFTTTTPVEYDGSTNWNLANIEIDGVTFYIVSNSTDFFGIQFYVSQSEELNIQVLKLEIGTQQTLVHQDSKGDWVLNDIPNFAEESAKCSQYGYTNDEYLGDIPYGYVEEEITVWSAEDLDARLERIYNSMPNSRMKYILVYFATPHPILGGSTRLMQIFKANSSYGTIKAIRYAGNDTGVTIEHTRSRNNGAWTDWAKIYNDHSKPTLAELGAAPSGYGLGVVSGVMNVTSDCNNATSNGWYRIRSFTINGIGVDAVMRVDSLSTTCVMQTAYSNSIENSGAMSIMCRAYNSNGFWGEWEWVNPPMLKDVEYRTTERYLGKSVYKKVDQSGNILWRTEDESNWRTTTTTSLVPASIE